MPKGNDVSYPPDKFKLIKQIIGLLNSLNDLEEHTDNNYRWILIKRYKNGKEHDYNSDNVLNPQ